MPKIAVTGYQGLIGSELIRRDCVPLKCDVTDKEEVEHEINSVVPDVIIHCAAATNIEWCELHNREAFNVNTSSVYNILNAFDGTFIFLSSVHIFNGHFRFWPYSEKHLPDPVNIYGFTKWAGEIAALNFNRGKSICIRISKVFDYEYLKPTLTALVMYEALDFPKFITRSFVHVKHFVDGLMCLVDIADTVPDVINISGTQTLDYYKFWVAVAQKFELDEKLIIARSNEIEAAPRPFRGGLDVGLAKKLGIPLYSVYDGLELIKEENE